MRGADDRFALGIERHGVDGLPVARMATPASWIGRSCLEIQRVSFGEDSFIFPRMALRWAHIADSAMPVHVVIPVHERGHPVTSIVEIGKAGVGELRTVLHGAEQRFDKSIRVH